MARTVIAYLIAVTGAIAQPPAAMVNPDRTVTFTLNAPRAQSVVVNADFPSGLRNLELQKSNAGEWTMTTAPLLQGSYYFRFLVDGLPVMLSPVGPYIASVASMDVVHIRGNDPLPYDATDPATPRGTMALETFYSDVLGRSVKYAVYTPPGYRLSQKLYPVLYLLHGNNGIDPPLEEGKQRFPINPLLWMDNGFADRIADRLISDGAIPEVILVSLDSQTPRALPPVTPELELDSLNIFEKYLVDEVIPRVEAQYRAKAEQPARWIAGTSRGAIQTLHVGLRRPGLFSALGVFSPGAFGPFPDLYPALRDPSSLNSQMRLLYLAVGRDDTIVTFPAVQTIHETLDRAGIRHTFAPSDGEHSFQNWRLYLAEFLKTLR